MGKVRGTRDVATSDEAILGERNDVFLTPVGLKAATGLAARTNSYQDLDDAPLIPEGYGAPSVDFLIGNSGATIPGVVPNMTATWMARDTWANLYSAQWLSANSGYQSLIAANPTMAVDIGVPLFPHDMDKTGANWNSLLDTIINNGTVSIGSSSVTTDALYLQLGRSLSNQTPLQGGTLKARLMWEFNMNPIANNIDRSKFIAAWNRAVPLIRQGFAAKSAEASRGQTLQIVFCPISDGADYVPFYPDNANVDIIALDAYAAMWGTTIPSESTLLSYVQGKLDALTAFAASKGKPMALGEWGNWQAGTAGGSATSHGRGDFPQYIDQIFDWAEAENVDYICYFNIPDGGVGQTFANTPLSLARYQERSTGSSGLPTMATLDPTTGKLYEGQVPDRLSQASLDSLYAGTAASASPASAPAGLGIARAAFATRTANPVRIVFAGDSITANTGATSPATGWPQLLLSALQAQYPSGLGTEQTVVVSSSASFGTPNRTAGLEGYNCGISGSTSANYLTSGMITAIGALNPRVVIHTVGTNDIRNGITAAAMKTNLLAKITSLRAVITGPSVHVLVHLYEPFDAGWTAPSPWAAYGQAMQQLAAADPSIIYLDLSDAFALVGAPGTDPLNLINADNLHPGDAGHAFIADMDYRALVGPVVSGVTGAPTPIALTATPNNGSVTLSAVGGIGADTFAVYRGTTATGTPIASALPFTDGSRTNGTAYSYVVVASNLLGSVTSNVATATPTGPAVTVVGQDSFTRSDSSTTLGSAETGGAYTVTGGTFGIVSGKAKLLTAGSGFSTATLASGQADVTVKATVTTNVGDQGIVLRAVDGLNYILMRTGGNSNANYEVFLIQNGAGTQLVSAAHGQSLPLTISLAASGTTVTPYVNGVAMTPLTISTFQSATKHGIWGNAATGGTFDDLLITSPQASVSYIVRDTFTDTDGLSLASHVGETGASWTKNASSTSSFAAITNGRVRQAGSNVTSLFYASGAPASANYSVEADFYFASIPTNAYAAIHARLDMNGVTHYGLRYSQAAGWGLTRIISSSSALLQAISGTPAAGSTVHAKLTVSGSTLTAYLDGVQVAQVTDTGITAAGRPGLSLNGPASGTGTGIHIDNYAATAL